MDLTFRIRTVAEKTATGAATIRAWERRYGIPMPRRAANNYRLYSAQDIADIRRMSALVSEGVAPAEAAEMVKEEKKDAACADIGDAKRPVETVHGGSEGSEVGRKPSRGTAPHRNRRKRDGE